MRDIGMNQECVNRLASMKNPIIVPSYKHPLPENPFAKGVSINQDIVYDVSDSGCVSVDVKSTEELYDLRNADIYANHPTLEEDLRKCFEEPKKRRNFHITWEIALAEYEKRRQLLALGREEE